MPFLQRKTFVRNVQSHCNTCGVFDNCASGDKIIKSGASGDKMIKSGDKKKEIYKIKHSDFHLRPDFKYSIILVSTSF